MPVVDTNVLAYAVNTEATEHRRCSRLIDQLRRQDTPWFLTWSIVYEFLTVTTHRRFSSRPLTAGEAWGFVEALVESPSLQILLPTQRHSLVLARILGELPQLSGSRFHDAHIAALMREHGIRRIVTRDRDFRHFPFIEVVDPLLAEPL